jgi:hypothetical protein
MIIWRFILVLAAVLALGTLADGTPAFAAAPPYEQIDPAAYAPNFWGGGLALSSYSAHVSNNAIRIQSLPGTGNFQLLDLLHGGCVGDSLGSPGTHRAAGGADCNSTTTGGGGDWGTRFQRVPDAICPYGYFKYWNYHWQGYLGFTDGNGHPVYLDTTGTCLKQITS